MRFFSFTFFSFLLFITTASAEQVSISITLPDGQAPKQASGLIFTTDGLEEIPKANIQQIEEDVYNVQYTYTPKKNSFLSAMIETDQQQVFYGTVIQQEFAQQKQPALPICSSNAQVPVHLEGQLALLQSLVEIRKTRRDVVKLQTEKTLNKELIDRLTKIEAGFGLQTNKPITTEMHPTELALRLARIVKAIENFQARKSE